MSRGPEFPFRLARQKNSERFLQETFMDLEKYEA